MTVFWHLLLNTKMKITNQGKVINLKDYGYRTQFFRAVWKLMNKTSEMVRRAYLQDHGT